jgi:hypothetical protein
MKDSREEEISSDLDGQGSLWNCCLQISSNGFSGVC